MKTELSTERIELTTQLLWYISQHYPLQKIAKKLDRSVSTIHAWVSKLKEEGLIYGELTFSGTRDSRRYLTQKGRLFMHANWDMIDHE